MIPRCKIKSLEDDSEKQGIFSGAEYKSLKKF